MQMLKMTQIVQKLYSKVHVLEVTILRMFFDVDTAFAQNVLHTSSPKRDCVSHLLIPGRVFIFQPDSISHTKTICVPQCSDIVFIIIDIIKHIYKVHFRRRLFLMWGDLSVITYCLVCSQVV